MRMRRRNDVDEILRAAVGVLALVVAVALLTALAYVVATPRFATGDRQRAAVALVAIACLVAIVLVVRAMTAKRMRSPRSYHREPGSLGPPRTSAPPRRPPSSPAGAGRDPARPPAPPAAMRVPESGPPVRLPGDPSADAVQVSVFAPAVAEVGATLLVQVFAHLAERAPEALAMAQEFDVDAARRGRHTLHVPVARGSGLVFELAMGTLRVAEAVQRLVWRGDVDSVGFTVEVPGGSVPGSTVVGVVSVRCEGIPVGQVTFKLQIGSAPSKQEREALAVGRAEHFERAFLSYAGEDRAKVLEAVKTVRALGMRFFQDVLSLDPGERWERRLFEELDSSDVLLLFWSRAAKQSKWVLEEVRYALARHGGDPDAPPAIRPVFIEGPPVEAPWEELAELADLQWDDRLLYMKL